jgi:uncharacterized membrane protein HdeD (DUF308 family)
MTTVLARNWWAVALRGLAAIIVGLAAFVLPGVTLAALVLLVAWYALFDGVFAIIGAVRAAEQHERWGPMLVEGLAGLAAGVLTLGWPGVTAVVLVYVIGVWAIVVGILKLVGAVRLRRVIHGEWLLGLNGVLSVLFGLLILAFPGGGLLSLVWLIGWYAILRGLALLALGVRLRRHHLRPATP